MDFKEEWNWLNSYQMEAVTDENDACIVNANVGSGKTTVLIAKILYLHYENSEKTFRLLHIMSAKTYNQFFFQRFSLLKI